MNTSLTTIITSSGARYEVDEAFGSPVVRRMAPAGTARDALAAEWPDGTTKFVGEVKIVDHPRATMNGGECALLILTDEGYVMTSPILSITDGVLADFDRADALARTYTDLVG